MTKGHDPQTGYPLDWWNDPDEQEVLAELDEPGDVGFWLVTGLAMAVAGVMCWIIL